MIRQTSTAFVASVATLLLASGSHVRAQAQPPAQAAAPIDLTGTWVSIVTEDWVQRMVTPKKGDYASLPLTPAAQDAAKSADMVAVQRGGRACEAYGAPIVMREPGRVRISWQDANTLKIETDAGEQTKLLHFGDQTAASTEHTRQGWSTAEWQMNVPAGRGRGRRGGGFLGGGPPPGAPPAGGPPPGGPGGRGAAPSGGRLKVTTTSLAPGFLRKNGVPYSARTTLTEYFNLLEEPNNGPKWFVVTTIVHDPDNLLVDYITSTNFRKEPDASKWRPRPCSID